MYQGTARDKDKLTLCTRVHTMENQVVWCIVFLVRLYGIQEELLLSSRCQRPRPDVLVKVF